MKFSDAIERGAYGLLTPGPNWQTDVYYAAYRGVNGRDPTLPELAEFYHQEPWGFPGDQEYAVRLMTVFGCKWSEVIAKLRERGL